MKQASRDGRIELTRFLFCLLIACFHSFLVCPDGESVFPYAYIFVEFFFCLSGYFAVAHFLRATPDPAAGSHAARSALAYTVHKLIPVWICSFGIVFVRTVLTWLSAHGTLLNLFGRLAARLPEAALLNGFLLHADYCTPPLWYAAALFVALPVFLYLLLRLPDLFSHMIVWMLPLFVYGTLLSKFETVQNVYFFLPALLRALAGLCLGGCAYFVSERLRSCACTRLLKILLSALTIGSFLGAVLLSSGLAAGRCDAIVIALLWVFLTALVSDQTCLRPFSGRVSGFLGAITLPMYLTQYLAGELTAQYFPLQPYGVRLLLMLGLTFLFGLLLYGFLLLVQKPDWKKLVLKSSSDH